MKIQPHYKPEKVASNDDERPNLWHPYLDTRHEAVVATNGYALVAVPVTLDEGDRAGHIQRELLQVARRKEKKLPNEIRDREELLPHGITYPPPQAVGPFPDWRAVLPSWDEGDEGTVTVGLSARLLKQIADALGCDGIVALTVKTDQRDTAPLLVRALGGHENEIGVLMPCRIDAKSGKPAKQTPVVDLPPTESERKKAERAELERQADELLETGGDADLNAKSLKGDAVARVNR